MAPLLGLFVAALAACAPDVGGGPVDARRRELEARVQELERLLKAERESRETERQAYAEERARLDCELADLRGELTAREDEFLRTLQAVGTLSPEALPPGWELAQASERASTDAPTPDDSPAEDPALAEARERAGERLRTLRNLLAIEEIFGLDLLEVGQLSEHATGPVVFRTLDGRGRPAGSVYAERLRLEGSRAARTVTIVLEAGYELRGGEKVLFDGATDPDGKDGVRRIQLAHVDPTPWIEAVPELFGPKAAAEPDDDGLHDPRVVRETLNRLLAEDAANGYYELEDFAGTVAGVLRKVVLRHRDRDGKQERMLFADRMRVEPQGESLCLVLEDGAQVRGDEKAPFLDGRYRIFLPRAKLAAWRDAGVPGLPTPPGPFPAPLPEKDAPREPAGDGENAPARDAPIDH
ncbi:MAG: hypothetical protein HZA52_13520 [Planctomycetes bacterium]|nr:hypothetical protein [Planctomycetota bacterium]